MMTIQFAGNAPVHLVITSPYYRVKAVTESGKRKPKGAKSQARANEPIIFAVGKEEK